MKSNGGRRNSGRPAPAANPDEVATVRTDAIDLDLLLRISEDARSSVRGLAAKVGMSAPPVSERLARLERQGVISGYRAEIDWARLGYRLVAFISVICVQGFEQSRTVAALEELPEVESVDLVTGSADLLVRLRVRDIDHLRVCIMGGVWNVPGIERTETSICLGRAARIPFQTKLVRALLEEERGRRASS